MSRKAKSLLEDVEKEVDVELYADGAFDDRPVTPNQYKRAQRDRGVRNTLAKIMEGEEVSNKAGRRTSDMIERDMVDEARLYLHGWSFSEIAQWMTDNRVYWFTDNMVKSDIEKLHDRWEKSSLDDYDKLLGKELARIDALEKAAWESFDRSLKDKEVETLNEISDEQARGGQGVVGSSDLDTRAEGQAEGEPGRG